MSRVEGYCGAGYEQIKVGPGQIKLDWLFLTNLVGLTLDRNSAQEQT